MKKRFTPRERGKTENHMDAEPTRDAQAVILPLSMISVPGNIRQALEGIPELAQSIRVHGLLQPLVVSRVGGKFELVAGQRRLAAIMSLGWKETPVRILGAEAGEVAVLRLIENLQREDLSGIEEVRAVAALLPLFDGNQSAVARAVGKDQSYVSRCVRAAKFLTENPTYAAPHSLSKTMLFELVEAGKPAEVAQKVAAGEVKTTREARQRSGAVAGGRYVARAIQFREQNEGRGFSLKLNYDPDRTPGGTRKQIIAKLEEILARLRAP